MAIIYIRRSLFACRNHTANRFRRCRQGEIPTVQTFPFPQHAFNVGLYALIASL